MSLSCSTRRAVRAAAALGIAIGALASAGGATAATHDAAAARSQQTYTWSADLEAYDAGSHTVTLRAMLYSDADAPDKGALKAGDRVTLTWSGLSTGAGIRAIERGTNTKYDRMTMPVEFVATELDDRYVSFKLPVPAKDGDALAKLKPGDYVTVTSPLKAKSPDDVVMAIRDYNDVG